MRHLAASVLCCKGCRSAVAPSRQELALVPDGPKCSRHRERSVGGASRGTTAVHREALMTYAHGSDGRFRSQVQVRPSTRVVREGLVSEDREVTVRGTRRGALRDGLAPLQYRGRTTAADRSSGVSVIRASCDAGVEVRVIGSRPRRAPTRRRLPSVKPGGTRCTPSDGCAGKTIESLFANEGRRSPRGDADLKRRTVARHALRDAERIRRASPVVEIYSREDMEKLGEPHLRQVASALPCKRRCRVSVIIDGDPRNNARCG